MEKGQPQKLFLDLKLLKRNNLDVPGSNPDYKSLDEDEEEDKQETEKAVLKLPPSLGDILSKKQNGSMIDDDAQEIRNNKLPVLDDQIKDYEEDFPNDKEKRGCFVIFSDVPGCIRTRHSGYSLHLVEICFLYIA